MLKKYYFRNTCQLKVDAYLVESKNKITAKANSSQSCLQYVAAASSLTRADADKQRAECGK